MLPSLQNIHAVKICQHVCDLSVMDVGALSFKLFCFFPEEVRMCLKGTGLLNKLKELEKLFCSLRLETGFSR